MKMGYMRYNYCCMQLVRENYEGKSTVIVSSRDKINNKNTSN